MPGPPSAILGVDVGGTFTDAVLLEDGGLHTAKVPTAAARRVGRGGRRAAGGGGPAVDRFTHGTTVATNALLERKGRADGLRRDRGLRGPAAPAAAGSRPPLRSAPPPEPLVPLGAASESASAPGRTAPPRRSASSVTACLDAEAIAVCLLLCVPRSAHERRSPRARRGIPAAHIVASHEVAPEFREYERASTTVVNAYLGPLVGRYLRRLATRARRRTAGTARDALVGRRGARSTRRRRTRAARSSRGPPAGVVGAARVARSPGFEDAIAFDMGGTSTDVCLDAGGACRAPGGARRSAGSRSGCRCSTSTPSGRRRVDRLARRRRRAARGPESAGADPGPPATAAAGRGRR